MCPRPRQQPASHKLCVGNRPVAHSVIRPLAGDSLHLLVWAHMMAAMSALSSALVRAPW